MSEERVKAQVKQQEALQLKRQEASHKYTESVYEALNVNELNGVKLSKKNQAALYNGLVQPNYTSASGKKTNEFGMLIEKHQYVEPNHGLIAEALWLLKDPEGYRAELRKVGAKKETSKTLRKLKTEQAAKKTVTKESNPSNVEKRKPGIDRGQNRGFFKP